MAAIYIVRDPRNLITSLGYHYELSLEEAFSFLTNKKKIIFPINVEEQKKDIKAIEDFNFLSDWSTHYQSWKNINFCPIKIIKYEDVENLDAKSLLKINVKDDKIHTEIEARTKNFDHQLGNFDQNAF